MGEKNIYFDTFASFAKLSPFGREHEVSWGKAKHFARERKNIDLLLFLPSHFFHPHVPLHFYLNDIKISPSQSKPSTH